MRKWIPAVLVLAGIALGAMVYVRLAEPVILRWEALGLRATVPAAPMPRAMVAFGFPFAGLLAWLLLRGIASPAGERFGRRIFPGWMLSERTGTEGVRRFENTFDIISIGVVTLFLLLHGLTLAVALGWPQWTSRAIVMLLGAGLVAVGNVMPRTRPNWVAGLRTRRTLSDPDAWRHTHRWFGGLLMVVGLAVIVTGFFGVAVALLVALAGTLASAVLATILGSRRTGPASMETR